jgi:hypothetical protein
MGVNKPSRHHVPAHAATAITVEVTGIVQFGSVR